jgi:hypothetical protein
MPETDEGVEGDQEDGDEDRDGNENGDGDGRSDILLSPTVSENEDGGISSHHGVEF